MSTFYPNQKLDAAAAGPVYGYDGKGRLQTRTWARSVGGQTVTTTYTYNLAGDVRLIDYSDSTPDVALSYDARGRVARRVEGTGMLARTTTLGYAHGKGSVRACVQKNADRGKGRRGEGQSGMALS